MPTMFEQFDQAIGALFTGSSAESHELEPMLAVARDLLDLPRESFKARLKSELERKSSMATQAAPALQAAVARLRVKNTAAAIDFYTKAFGAKELSRFEVHGTIPYAEMAIGNSVISLGESSPEAGYPGPETLGGSPVSIHLNVDEVDAFVTKAVDAGAKVVSPVRDQFYGERSGQVSDPFGYTWSIGTLKEQLTIEEMHRRFEAMERESAPKPTGVSPIPKGYHTITPYLIAENAAALIEFAKHTFGAQETFHAIGSGGGIHAEVRIGDSMLMMGGGGPGLSFRGPALPTALHVYVEDVDAAHQHGVKAGGVTIQPPADQEYGERSSSLKDPAGNHWYIATAKGASYIPEGLRNVNVYLHPLRAEPVIGFLTRAFGAVELEKYATPDGVIHHARVRIGDSVLEMGEAHGPYQPMPTMFYLYVPDVDALYQRAIKAGATSLSEPADQPYGDRSAGVKDAFGNQWYIATHIKDMAP
ncbi:MAG TPA: VOC family protein [Bryobacteraceae bacterium]|nr:VOC family protein [Bryobacteraceae bacterium]